MMKFKNFLNEYKFMGFDVDDKIKVDYVKRLNRIQKIDVRSLCQGHPKGAHIVFTITSFEEKTIEDSKSELNKIVNFFESKIKNSKVYWNAWGFIEGVKDLTNIYDSIDGFNTYLIKKYKKIEEELQKTKIHQVFIHIDSTISNKNKEIDDWWKDSVRFVEEKFK